MSTVTFTREKFYDPQTTTRQTNSDVISLCVSISMFLLPGVADTDVLINELYFMSFPIRVLVYCLFDRCVVKMLLIESE